MKPRRLSSHVFVTYLSLFTSLGTLLCCALPSLFVALGLGATVAGVIGVFPQIVVLSVHKKWVFAISGTLILFAIGALYAQRNAPCPIDPQEARACAVARKWSVRVVAISCFIWCCGFFAAYVLSGIF